MKRYRGESPSATKWRRSWLQYEQWEWWPYRPRKKWGARLRRRMARQLEEMYHP